MRSDPTTYGAENTPWRERILRRALRCTIHKSQALASCRPAGRTRGWCTNLTAPMPCGYWVIPIRLSGGQVRRSNWPGGYSNHSARFLPCFPMPWFIFCAGNFKLR